MKEIEEDYKEHMQKKYKCAARQEQHLLQFIQKAFPEHTLNPSRALSKVPSLLLLQHMSKPL